MARTMAQPAASPQQEPRSRLAGLRGLACLLTLVIALVSTCRGERVHFRIHASDLMDQHTHTRTVLLRPGSETLRQLRQLRQMQPQAPPQLLYFQPGVRAAPQQPVSFMRQTLQLQLQSRQPQQQPQQQQPQQQQPQQQQQQPGAGQRQRPLFRTGHGPPPAATNPGLGATHIQQVPLMPIIPLTPLPGPAGGRQVLSSPGTFLMPDSGPHPALSFPGLTSAAGPAAPGAPGAPAAPTGPTQPRAAAKKPSVPQAPQAALVTHHMPGPGPWPMHMLLPNGPKGELVPMKLVAVAHAAPAAAPRPVQPAPAPAAQPAQPAQLLSVPSVADLKKGSRCKGFVKPGEDPEAGDCFLEEYENGYNEAHSTKTFFGDNKSDSKHEKGGGRNTKRYEKELSKYATQQPLKAVHVVGPLFKSAKQSAAPADEAAAEPPNPARVTVVRLPPGGTAVTTVVSSESSSDDTSQDGQDGQDLQDDEEDEAAPQQDEEMDQADQSLDPQYRGDGNDDDADVEVFKQPKRAARARLAAPLIAVSPAKSMWVQELHPVRIKQMDEVEFEAEESAPAQVVVVSPEQAMARGHLQPRGPAAAGAAQPRALDDMDLGWGAGFSEDLFEADEPAESENMEAEVDAADFDHSIDDDKESAALADDDDDDRDDEQDHSATEHVNGLKGALGTSGDSHSMMVTKGPSEKLVRRSRPGQGAADPAGSPPLGAIMASAGHVFAPTTPPPPHPAAYGAQDPDRLESGRRAPVVVEFGHELSDFKETRERQQKKW